MCLVTGMNHSRYQTLLLAVAAIVWTAAGETSDPLLAGAELPADVVANCETRTNTGCDTVLSHYWLGRAAQGELFLVLRAGCHGECDAWLVQRSARGTRTLLAINGQFRLARASGPYPAVQVRTESNPSRASYTRYAWNGRAYAPGESREVYRVDGTECGTAAECEAIANAALVEGANERAVRIYEQVRGVGFI